MSTEADTGPATREPRANGDVMDDGDVTEDGARGALRLVVVSGGTSDPSSTRMLADRLAASVVSSGSRHGRTVRVDVVELRSLANEISTAIVSGFVGPGSERAAGLLRAADGVVVATPVYKAEPSGLFTSFFHVLDSDLLIGTPVVLAATAGTPRHALVVDGAMRSLFAFLRSLIAPTGVFASTEDWNDPGLVARIDRAASELFLLMDSGFASRLREVPGRATSTRSGRSPRVGRGSISIRTSCDSRPVGRSTERRSGRARVTGWQRSTPGVAQSRSAS